MPPNGSAESAEVYLSNGTGNQFMHDTIDGGWDGNLATYQRQGSDDGVILLSEQNITIQNCTITNVFDAGVEGVDGAVLMNETITGNTFSNNGYTAIGNYYGPGWQNSTFSSNTSAGTPQFIRFVEDYGFGKYPGVVFVNNRIASNVVQSQVPLAPLYGGSVPPSITINYLGAVPFTVNGNTLQGNQLGTATTPVLLPWGGYIDGGGNVCQSGGFLACVGPSGFILRRR
jgi:hypothetical protein